eukprot:749383-Hanusia_phi.AAC.1
MHQQHQQHQQHEHEQQQQQHSRRKIIQIASFSALTSLAPPARAAGRYGRGDYSYLESRAVGEDKLISNPGFGYDACFGLCSEKQLFYPDWMEGEWSSSCVLTSKFFPLGEDLMYRNLRRGSARSEEERIGQKTTFNSKYVTVDEKKRQGNRLCVIADRSFNTA